MSASTSQGRYEPLLELNESVVEVEPIVSATMLELVAPATLQEGYELEVNVGGELLRVIVPPGGVEQGQTFKAPVAPSSTMEFNRLAAPVGAWRDGLCCCCNSGCCHPLFCTAYWCHPVVMAQVLFRMKLDWCGLPTSREKASQSFFIVIGIIVGYFLMRWFIIPLSNGSTAPKKALKEDVLPLVLDLSMLVYAVLLTCRVRRFMRHKYSIPASSCCPECCDDCCCAFWCRCCVLTQMARHTTDYDKYPAQCCSKSGMPSHVPEVV